jgi:hypothetical protein
VRKFFLKKKNPQKKSLQGVAVRKFSQRSSILLKKKNPQKKYKNPSREELCKVLDLTAISKKPKDNEFQQCLGPCMAASKKLAGMCDNRTE